MNMIGDNQIWGEGEIRDFVPPDEVVEQILGMPEVAMDYPDVYEAALRIKNRLAAEDKDCTDLHGL